MNTLHPIRARLTAAALAAGAVALGVVNLTSPWLASTDQVATVREQGGAIVVNSLLWFGASLLLVAACAGIAGAVRAKGQGLALAGALVAGAATVSSAIVAGLESVSVSLSSAITDDTELRAALATFDTEPVLIVVFLLWLLGSAVGWPLLFAGAARGGLIRWWIAVPVGVAMVGQVLVQSDNLVVTGLLVAAFVVPCVVLAVRLVRTTARPVVERPVSEVVPA